MSRYGRIDFDFDDVDFNAFRIALPNELICIFDNITFHIKKDYPELKRATGSWYINYGFNKRVIFFKIEPDPQNNCVYIAVHDEDYSHLTEDSKGTRFVKAGN